MTKQKSTKKALLMSALSLFVCVSMLIGSTFAWFTDSVTSSGNIIKSGTLDVTMEWKDATDTGKQVTYKDASEGAIFNSELWEPGYVEAKNIKISNVGTLALKYHLNIAANGEVSELANVIDVYFAEGEHTLASREMSELTLVGTLSDILEGMPGNMSGDLKAEEYDTVTIALKMKEDAGNEYQGLSIGSDFSVILMATQDNVEVDSFDENYDDIEIPELHIETIDGVTYGRAIDGNYYMISVDDYTLTSYAVDDDVTVLGTGNGANDNDRVFGKNAPLASLTLNEGLVEIKDNALNALPNLTSVNLPSTLKTIGIQSFRMTGMSELTIPENVETIKAGAFRDMANLTTVTVEGNVAFDNYAFRSCPKLESIYLLGDDVTFNNSNMFASHSDNGDANGITIYVKNATVAARVYAAQSSAYGYKVKILGDEADGSDASTVTQATTQEALATALKGGESVVLAAGTYTVPSVLAGSEVTIGGSEDTVINLTANLAPSGQTVSTINFEGVTITGSDYTNGMTYTKSTFTNCVFKTINTYLYNDTKFVGCDFYVDGDYYSLWTWGAGTVEFDDCDFYTQGKAIYMNANYTTHASGYMYEDVIVNNCRFYDQGDDTITNKAAIEIGDDYNRAVYNLYINDTTVEGFAVTEQKKDMGGTSLGTNVWGNKYLISDTNLNVVIDGVDVY